MNNKLLIVVDMQNDFTFGALKNDDAVSVIPKIKSKLNSFNGDVIFTRDTHTNEYMNTQEGRKLPVPHCIKGENGYEIVDELKDIQQKNNYPVYDKPTFGCMKLAEDIAAKNCYDEIELVGVCTDICVISNAMLIKAAVPEVTVKVDSSCCAGVTKESHDIALKAMAGCQIEVY